MLPEYETNWNVYCVSSPPKLESASRFLNLRIYGIFVGFVEYASDWKEYIYVALPV